MGKSFKDAPARSPSKAEADAYVKGSAALAAAVAPSAASNTEPAPAGGPKEKLARLSLDMSPELHSRFKAACARSRLKMTAEILGFIERRTQELEGKS